MEAGCFHLCRDQHVKVRRLSQGFRRFQLNRSITWICYEQIFCAVIALTDLFNEQERKQNNCKFGDRQRWGCTWLSCFENSVDFLRPDEDVCRGLVTLMAVGEATRSMYSVGWLPTGFLNSITKLGFSGKKEQERKFEYQKDVWNQVWLETRLEITCCLHVTICAILHFMR